MKENHHYVQLLGGAMRFCEVAPKIKSLKILIPYRKYLK